MNPKVFELYREIKPYLVFNKEKCCDELKKDAPEEIKKKYDEYINLSDDNILIDDDNEQSTQE